MNRFARVRHLLQWELFRARSWMLALLAVSAAAALATSFRQWDGGVSTLPFLVLLAALFGAASVMTGEPPLDPTSFSVGKPIDRVALVVVKLVVSVVVCMLSVLMFQAVVQASLGMPWSGVWNDFVVSAALFQPTLFGMLVISVVARSLKQVIVGAVVLFASLNIGTQLLVWSAGSVAGSARLFVTPGALRVIGAMSLYLPLVFVARMLYRPLSARLARTSVVALVVFQLFAMVTAAFATQSIEAQATNRSQLSIDSVSVAVGRDQYRVAFHLLGGTDSSGTVFDYTQVLAVSSHDGRADTLDFVGREDIDGGVVTDGENARVIALREQSRQTGVRDRLVRSGVFLLKPRDSSARAGTLSIRLRATRYHHEPLQSVPLVVGTLFERDGVRLKTYVDSLGRTVMQMTDVGGGFFSGSFAGETFSRLEMRVEQPGTTCCTPLDLTYTGSPGVAFVLLPGASRTRAEAWIGGDYQSLVAQRATLHISEWKRDTALVLEARGRVPGLSK